MNIDHYLDLRNVATIESVSLGYTTVALFSAAEVEDAQVGYSVSDSGERVTGDQEGDWKESWLVIGCEDLCGDPIFVDLAKPLLPVFTAAHGQGDWSPVMIASSWEGFIQALQLVKRVSIGRENPVKLQQNPLSAVEREQTLNRIAQLNRGASLEFWENWLRIEHGG